MALLRSGSVRVVDLSEMVFPFALVRLGRTARIAVAEWVSSRLGIKHQAGGSQVASRRAWLASSR